MSLKMSLAADAALGLRTEFFDEAPPSGKAGSIHTSWVEYTNAIDAAA
jgi:hypothetical protein